MCPWSQWPTPLTSKVRKPLAMTRSGITSTGKKTQTSPRDQIMLELFSPLLITNLHNLKNCCIPKCSLMIIRILSYSQGHPVRKVVNCKALSVGSGSTGAYRYSICSLHQYFMVKGSTDNFYEHSLHCVQWGFDAEFARWQTTWLWKQSFVGKKNLFGYRGLDQANQGDRWKNIVMQTMKCVIL